MASLFSQSVIDEGLNRRNIGDFNDLHLKKEIVKNWTQSITGKKIKETEIRDVFCTNIFKDLLGYIFFGSGTNTLNFKPEYHIQGAGRADFAIGDFNGNDIVEVVGEIKSLNQNLDNAQSGRTDYKNPVDQGFLYLHSLPSEAKFLIVTNMNEIRLYKRGVVNKYESFFFINPPENKLSLLDDRELQKFIYLLKKENLLTVEGESRTEKLFSLQEGKEEIVENEFYKEYKVLREQLFFQLLEQNKDYGNDKVKLLSLVQKFLDRIIFCWFCEDSREELLPKNVLLDLIKDQVNVKYYDKNGFSVYAQVKKLFKAIDSGDSVFKIEQGYNGGLFEKDSKLDDLQIPNYLFNKVMELSIKDFGTDKNLNVDILGHIFEKSIMDLEEMRAGFEGKGFDRKNSKKSKDGVFYTPEYITNYIVEQAVGGWLKNRFNALFEKEYKTPKEIAIEVFEKKILNNIVEIKEQEFIKTCYQKKDKCYSIKGIKQKEKKEVDRILKSIEYLEDKKKKKVYEMYKRVLQNIKVLDPACGSGAFLVQAFDFLMKENEKVVGVFNEIFDEHSLWDDAKSIKWILTNNLFGVDLNEESVEITKLSLWLKTAIKNKPLTDLDNNIKCGNSLIDDKAVAGNKAFDWKEKFEKIMGNGGFDVVIGNPPYIPIEMMSDTEKSTYKSNFSVLERKFDSSIVFILQGLNLLNHRGKLSFISSITWQTGENFILLRKLLLEKYAIMKLVNLPFDVFKDAYVDTGIYVIGKIPRKEYYDVFLFPKRYKISIIEGVKFQRVNFSDISSFDYKIILDAVLPKIIEKIKKQSIKLLGDITISTQGLAESFFDEISKEDNNSYPFLVGQGYRYLLVIEKIKYVDMNKHKNLIRFYEESPKLLIRRVINRQNRLMVTYIDKQLVFKKDLNPFIITNNSYYTKYILSLLNSKLISYLYYNGSILAQKDDFRQTTLAELRKLPIVTISLEDQQPVIKKADQILDLYKELHKKATDFLSWIQAIFKPEQISKKLKSSYQLDEQAFFEELKKQKIIPNRKEHLELKEGWEELIALYGKINETDKEIDEMVFDLYGLTEEEREIILGY